MSALLRRASLRYLRRHPWQLGLSILGVALGVAVVVSIDLANASAQRAFAISSEAVTGTATHRIERADAGLPEELYVRLRLELGLRRAAPVVEAWTAPISRPERTLRLLGIDPFAEAPFRAFVRGGAGSGVDVGRFLSRPGAVALARSTARELGVEVGDTLALDAAGIPRLVTLVGLFEPADELARQAGAELLLADLATAQELLGLEGRLTRIDLILPPPPQRERLIERITGYLPAGAELLPAGSGADTAEQMTRAFRLNLQALSLLALLCGAFLIYNTMTFAVVRRRSLLGTLRALGTTRRELLALVLGEALLIGVVGSIVGLLGGIALGRHLLSLVTQTINDLYFVTNVRSLEIGAWTLAKGLLLGVGATLLAALAPSLEATNTTPRAALARSEIETLAHRAVPRVSLAGALLLVAGAALLFLPGQSLAVAFVALFAILVGCALLTPVATIGLMRLLGPPAGLLFGQLGRMATRGVVAALSRTAIAVAALTMAISVAVGVDLMIRSFRSTVTDWLAYSLPADLYVSLYSSPARRFAAPEAALSQETVERLRRLPGVAAINTLRHLRLRADGRLLRALAIELSPMARGAFSFARGDPERLWEPFEEGRSVFVSEPLAWRYGLDAGSELTLSTPAGELTLPVAGIFYDYASEQGLILISRRTYVSWWGDDSVTALSFHGRSGADLERLADDVRAVLGPERRAEVRTTRALREESLRVFDRTFLVTGVLRLLAVAVAFVGVLSALMALQLERVREVGVLRACGLTPGQLWLLVTQQTGLMGMTAGLLALPVGLIMAAIMILVINRRSFGWSLGMEVSLWSLAGALATAVLAALLAGLYPAWKLSRTSAAEALREE